MIIQTLSLILTLVTAHATDTSGIPKFKPTDPLPANLFVELAKAVNPAVVNISTTYLPRQPHFRDPFFDMFDHLMGPNQFGRQVPQQSLGTGFIIREDGLIVTNNHVIDRADVIKVQISEKTKEIFDAQLIGKDAKTDIALIKIKANRKLPVVKLGSSSEVQVGEWVAAFGNPYGYGHTMTKGIISAVGREIDELNLFPFMQTDASINPGNSGGPLVNTQGQVVGVNTAIDARAQGIGFVIPIDNVKSVLPQLEKDGGISRGYIGVRMDDISEEGARLLGLKDTEGALITQVLPGAPAEKAGVKPYDLVVGFGPSKITSTRDLTKSLLTTPVGHQVDLKVLRNGKPKTLNVRVGTLNDVKTVLTKQQEKRGEGSKAGYKLGFAVTDYSPRLAQEFNLPRLNEPHPIVTAIEMDSPAAQSGLAPGDIILDVNRKPTSKASEVLQNLKSGTINILRVLKRDRVVLISVRASGP